MTLMQPCKLPDKDSDGKGDRYIHYQQSEGYEHLSEQIKLDGVNNMRGHTHPLANGYCLMSKKEYPQVVSSSPEDPKQHPTHP